MPQSGQKQPSRTLHRQECLCHKTDGKQLEIVVVGLLQARDFQRDAEIMRARFA